MDYAIYLSLSLYFILMLAIGLYSYKTADSDLSGYMLAGRALSPKVAALSAGASDMSGWILMGLPGAMMVSGVSSSWIAIGLIIGALANYQLVAPRLRVYTQLANDALTVPDYFSKRFNDQGASLRIISATVIIIFFTVYTSSGLVAGGKLFESSFALDYHLGILITAAVVVAYTLLGGFMAVSMTDFVQGCIMFVALVIVPITAYFEFDSITQVNQIVVTQNASFFNWFNGLSLLAIISSMAWGLGYFGQPHIIVRFMALDTVRNMPIMRNIGMTWMIVSLLGALAVGYIGVAFVSHFGYQQTDPETIFIVFSQVLFHPLISGFLLAAILAAIMSTISSQLLVTSSSLTDDIYKQLFNQQASQKTLVRVGRVCVFLVAVIAALFASDKNSSILSIVSNAWAGFGAAFGPLILFSLFWRKMTKQAALAGMVSGATTVLLWIYLPITINGHSLSQIIYEIVPGFVVSSLAIYIVSVYKPQQDEQVLQQFDEVNTQLANN